jgi:hypothetical protein
MPESFLHFLCPIYTKFEPLLKLLHTSRQIGQNPEPNSSIWTNAPQISQIPSGQMWPSAQLGSRRIIGGPVLQVTWWHVPGLWKIGNSKGLESSIFALLKTGFQPYKSQIHPGFHPNSEFLTAVTNIVVLVWCGNCHEAFVTYCRGTQKFTCCQECHFVKR